MSKKAFVFLCFALTTLAVSNRLIAQNPTISLSQSLTYSGIQDYLKENILELNPIEGIWFVEYSVVQSSFLYSEPLVEKTLVEFAIVNTSSGYKSVLVLASEKKLAERELNRIASLAFRQIGESSNYYCDVVYNGCAHQSTEKIRLSGNTFSMTFSVTDDSERGCLFNRAPGSAVKVQIKITGEKIYPTPSMIVQAVQKKQEEALRKAAEEEAHRIANEPKAWTGTGFSIGSNYIVTNHHVVEDAKTIVVKGVGGDFATEYEAEVIASDRISDLSIIAIKSPKSNSKVNLPYKVKTTLSDVGEDVFVLGYPLTATMGDEIKLTTGVVSSRSGFQGDVSLYQISAPVQPGNSGGPLFDNNGNVIGIVSAKHTGAENVGYAIKTSYLKNLMESAGVNASLPANNTISSLPLSGKVKAVKNYVYMIVCSSSGNGAISNTPTNSVQTNAEPNQSGWSQGGYTIHNPRVERNNSGGSTEILSVTIGTTYTAVELKYKNTKYIGGWCSIDKKTHIVADGKSYIMSRADGISYSPHTTSLEIGQSIIFTLYFPSIPSSVTKIDLVEPGSSSWQFYGINVQ